VAVKTENGDSGSKPAKQMVEISNFFATLNENENFTLQMRLDEGPDDVHFVVSVTNDVTLGVQMTMLV